MRPRRSRVVSPGTQSTASSPGVVRTVTAASRLDTGGMTTRCEDHDSDTRSPQRLSGTAAETSLVIRARSSIAVSLEPTTAWSSSDVADSVRSSEPTVGIQTSSWSPPSATDSKRRKRCRTNSSQSEESWGRIMSVIAIMLSVLRSHVEKKLTAVDHLPKVSRVTESIDFRGPRPVHLHPRSFCRSLSLCQRRTSSLKCVWCCLAPGTFFPWVPLPALPGSPRNRRGGRA